MGVDVLRVARMERELQRDPQGIRAELFSEREQADCDACAHPARHYAARFAAKEALFKAIDAADRDGASWREAEVRLGERGEPELRMHGRLRLLAERRHVRRVFVSLAHTPQVAVAAVLLEDEAPRAMPRTREDLEP